MRSLLSAGLACLVAASYSFGASLSRTELQGKYIEARNADVYTGPCFANGEVNLTGDLAVFGWNIEKGSFNGTPLDGLSVVGVVRASNTLGNSTETAYPVKSVLIIDQRANAEQRVALKGFAQHMAGDLLSDVDYQPIQLNVEGNNVAREAKSYGGSYKEGSGEGLRYTAFDRYAKMAQQSVERMQAPQRALAEFRASNKPLDPSEKQLRLFHQAYDTIPWSEVQQTLHGEKIARPPVPAYTDFIDRTVTGQEDLMLAFQELFTAPTGRHIFSFALAAFIDIIVFLLAFASGPYFFGAPQQRWISASAALDGLDGKVFVRNFLAKLTPGLRGLARVDAAALSAGEQQFCMILAAKRLAAPVDEGARTFYVLDEQVHESLLESLATGDLFVRASSRRAAA